MRLTWDCDDITVSVSHPDSDLEDETGKYDDFGIALLLADVLERMKLPRPLSVLSQAIQFMSESNSLGPAILPDEHGMVIEATYDYVQGVNSLSKGKVLLNGEIHPLSQDVFAGLTAI